MFDEIELGSEFFEKLTAIDRAIVERARGEECRFCSGPLHRGDYGRKPRGGIIAAGAEVFSRRFSLCCGRDGCRRRATPPSVRFLGRRVYVGAVVILASVALLAVATASAAKRATGISARTMRRWLRWWRGPFMTTRVFVEIAARITIERRRVPLSILETLGDSATNRVRRLLGWLAPITTTSMLDGSRFVRGLV